jgi:hypothetical protein
VSAPAHPEIGYRRRSVRVRLPGDWSIDIPGSCAETFEDRGRQFCAWDPPRTIWFSSYSFGEVGGRPPAAEELLLRVETGDGEPLEHRGARVVGRAVIGRASENGHSYWQLAGHSAVAGGIALATLCFDEESDRDWAISTWRSIDHPTPRF